MKPSLDKLRALKTIIVHDDCPDGLASAMILRDALPKAKIIFVKHNSPEHLGLKAEEGVVFCDFAPHASTADALREAGAIILDHHKTVKDLVLSFGDNGIFGDEETEPGVSGAVLAYREVWLPLLADRQEDFAAGVNEINWVKRFAKVAGVRDTWQKDSPLWRESCAQAEVLRFFPKSTWLDEAAGDTPDVFCRKDPSKWIARMSVGEVLLSRVEESTKKTLNGGLRFTVPGGPRMLIFQGLHTSDVAEAVRSEVDLVVGWTYFVEDTTQTKKMVLSCRSGDMFDASVLAKSFGGGGHTRAAGFQLGVQSSDLNPYEFIKTLITQYCAELAKPK